MVEDAQISEGYCKRGDFPKIGVSPTRPFQGRQRWIEHTEEHCEPSSERERAGIFG